MTNMVHLPSGDISSGDQFSSFNDKMSVSAGIPMNFCQLVWQFERQLMFCRSVQKWTYLGSAFW